jgi:hypothetical protein
VPPGFVEDQGSLRRQRQARAVRVDWAVGGPTAPYFRFPAPAQPLDLIDYLGKRNIAIFSAEID